MNEPAWILFIVIKYQVKSNNSDNVMKIIWNVNVYYW